ncbi:MAG: tetraacyldisaccharide 4'-kinase [Chryseolinea sp.]
MVILRILLFPFAVLYNLITRFRNRLYDQGFRPSVAFDLPVISVGNLTVGGTGKTPMIEHLIRLLSNDHKVATLSRGYGRTTKGIRLASKMDNAFTLGDEPYQFHRKYGDKVIVSVGEERALAIANIIQEAEDTQVVLLDDAFQHRRVRPSFSVLLSDYSRPFYTDFLLPTGRLRESRSQATRADVVVVTKCPSEITDDKMMRIEKAIRKYADKPVFFATIHYGIALPIGHAKGDIGRDVILVSGIANADPLLTYIKQGFELKEHVHFGDHHAYTTEDLEKIELIYQRYPGACILTTEKDMVKLDAPEFKSIIDKLPFFYLPIEVEFIKNGRDFDELVLNSVRRAH